MVNFNTLKNSKFLTKEDVTPDVLVTVATCIEQNVAMESQPVEMKYTLTFQELEKPLVLNFTNASLMAGITGREDTEDWIGAKVVLYNDPTIMFAGKMTGGIRVRAPQQSGQQQANTFAQNNNIPPDEDSGPPMEDTRDFGQGNPDDQII